MSEKKYMALEKEVLKVLTEIRDYLKPKSVEDERFIDNGDGTISDKQTRRMWQKEGSEKEMNFSDAEEYCNNSKVAGYDDWRLPTVDELNLLVDRSKHDPAISPKFSCKSSYYWTSTPYAGGSGSAWIVSFSYGYVGWDYKDSGSYVRPVRQY